ncbi:hypothetical protein [Planctobacterium marinum]|uniref:Solute-binding protein family 3/N-terminal domain-containing protein n=1 Tax=Planctobacterium marinum TaxID=1631968 RepID=A0AA48HSJ5_9ALTE|nr:hypothetical protein MACH26_34530 [Planctobacterium marinum]
MKLVEQGMGIDVFWAISTPERVNDLSQVDFDIFQGLFGYRLLLIKEARVTEFKTTGDIEIKNMLAGLSPDWPDYLILQKHGFNVQGTTSYSSLFKLLELERVDYLPRSMFEVWFEHEHLQTRGISVSPDVAIYYPTKFTFFLAKSNRELADELQKALQAMDGNGRFEQFFNLVWKDVIAKSSLQSKKIIRLSND